MILVLLVRYLFVYHCLTRRFVMPVYGGLSCDKVMFFNCFGVWWMLVGSNIFQRNFYCQKTVVGKLVFSIPSISRKCWRFTMVFLWDESQLSASSLMTRVGCVLRPIRFSAVLLAVWIRIWNLDGGSRQCRRGLTWLLSRSGRDRRGIMTCARNSVSEVHDTCRQPGNEKAIRWICWYGI